MLREKVYAHALRASHNPNITGRRLLCLLTAWVCEPRPEFGQEMSYGRSLERWLKLFDLPLRYTEWATLAQDRAEWARLITRKRLH